MDNSPELVCSIYGILKAGGTFVVLNSSVKHQKLSYILKDSMANIIITSYDKNEIIRKAMALINGESHVIWTDNNHVKPEIPGIISHQWTTIFNTDIPHALIKERIKEQVPRIIDQDIAALLYTSGSTGEPKGVISNHYNMISAARSIIRYLENKEDDIILNTLPLSFDYGLYQVLMAYMFGGTIILETNFMFLSDILKKLKVEKVTGFPIVPMMLTMLLNNIDLRKYDFPNLRYISNTGAALPVEHIKKLRKLLPDIQIYSMFGLTECKRVSYLPPEDIDKKPNSVGKAMPNCEVFIIDEHGNQVRTGEPGELVVRGSNVMQGYWNAQELTEKIYRKGLGYNGKLLFTGDYFEMDDEGYLYFLGRKDDMIKSRGERISAKEIENVIYQIKGVVECAVIGIPDETIGQSIKAFIVKNNGNNLSEEDVMKYCIENLESFSVPKMVKFVDILPKSPHGKIDKKALS